MKVSGSALSIIAAVLVVISFAPAVASAQSRSEQQLLGILSSSDLAPGEGRGLRGAQAHRHGTFGARPGRSLGRRGALPLRPLRARIDAGPEAGLALLQALDKTSGTASRQGSSIRSAGAARHGRRRPSIRLAGGRRPQVARAAATALGRIGGPQATRGLVLGRHGRGGAAGAAAALSTRFSRRPTGSSPRAAGDAHRPYSKSSFEDSGSGPHPGGGLSWHDHGRPSPAAPWNS